MESNGHWTSIVRVISAHRYTDSSDVDSQRWNRKVPLDLCLDIIVSTGPNSGSWSLVILEQVCWLVRVVHGSRKPDGCVRCVQLCSLINVEDNLPGSSML
jgi:hypothetical protein